MPIADLFSDPKYSDNEPHACSLSPIIPGSQGNLLSLLYLPGGKGPYPAVILFHGYPGCEQNLDLAQALRRIGFAVLTFHYAGSWNSEGDFSLMSCLRDSDSVLDELISKAAEWNIDPDRIFAAGHSMGGMVASHLLAKRPEISAGVLISPWDAGRTALNSSADPACNENLWEIINCGFGWLHGISHAGFEQELKDHAEDLCITSLAPLLVKKPVLCIAAEYDTDTPIALHAVPLHTAMIVSGADKFKYITFPTDHSFNDHRIALCSTVAEFLLNQL